jgi:pyridoxamine 5'-phosphate oxidase
MRLLSCSVVGGTTLVGLVTAFVAGKSAKDSSKLAALKIMTPPLPAFANSLEETRAEAFRTLGRAVADRRSAMHTPSVATLGLDGSPRSRVVVLRHFDGGERSLRFHTDIRSEKYEELQRDARISALFYDAGEKIQLRLSGHASLHVSDEVANQAWASSQAMSRHCYVTEPAPGSIIDEGHAFTLPKGRMLTDEGRPHFAAVVIHFNRLEWLWLGSEGHRRSMFEWQEKSDAPIMHWLVP